MSIVGLWPHQCARNRSRHYNAVVLIAISHIIPQAIAMIEYRDDWDIFMKSCISFFFIIAMLSKLFLSKWNVQIVSSIFFLILRIP